MAGAGDQLQDRRTEWLAARAETADRLGSAFDLRRFHTFALGLGPVGLAQLRAELAAFRG
ncbi:MAG: DUF885 family protein [Ilumatobacteraceae bacterium]